MSVLARFDSDHEGDVPILTVEGEIDASNSREFADRLRAALSNRARALIADLTPTTYLDSAAINVLFDLGGELRERQQQLHLVVAPSSPIARVLEIVGIPSLVPVHATRDAALVVVGAQ